MEGNPGQELPDRAEEKRVDVPQNETATPVEDAQADSSTPAQTTEVTETQTVRETTAGTDEG